MIYLDNNATTWIDPDVLDEMQRVSQTAGGNPGSRHVAGRKARQVLEDARESIAEIVGALPEEVIFTSGGTESSNLAISGLSARRTGTVLLPPGEHPATAEPVQRLLRSGWQMQHLEIDELGRLQPGAAPESRLQQVQLVTAILAHNETGVIHDLREIAGRCQQLGVPFHVDAVQAVGKIPVNFTELRATTLSAAAHKFHGPRGIGILLVRKGVKLPPLMRGGHQEQGIRPGTEPVMLAAGMSMALRKWHQNYEATTASVRAMRDRLQAGLQDRCAPAIVNGDQSSRLPNTLNIAFPGCEADSLLIALDLAGICCSLGSACASGSLEPSPILVAMQLPPEVYRSSLRLSLSCRNTIEEIDQAIEMISDVVHRLRSRK